MILKMKDKSKQRTNWLRQERNSKGHFMPYKEEKSALSQMYERILEISEKPMSNLYEEEGKLRIRFQEPPKIYKLADIEHAFLSGLKANNSFYPPSKLWGFYKRDRGIM